MDAPLPPKPVARRGRVTFRQYLRLFRRDILSALPERLFRAWMAEYRTPFFRSYLVNQPDLIDEVLRIRSAAFPKSRRIVEGLRPLLGAGVFLADGADWTRQRRIIDRAFEGGRLREAYPAMAEAARAAVDRMTEGVVEIEDAMRHATADVIFRTLFSRPIEDAAAARLLAAFADYQGSQPMVNLGAFLPLPSWVPRGYGGQARRAAKAIRAEIAELTAARLAELRDGRAPEDLASRILTTPDPETGKTLSAEDAVDEVAVFLLAGHETSASALSWALYLVAQHPDWQERIAAEAAALGALPDVADLPRLTVTRDVFREALRLYPPVPMLVRETRAPETFRARRIPVGAQIVISPWHLHRHERLWNRPDAFDPARWGTENGRACQRTAFLPFSAGPRACPGAGFALQEGVLILALLIRSFRFAPIEGDAPVPVAHLTIRAERGIRLRVARR